MKFFRLNKGSIRCILSSEDMKEYGLELKDILEQNEQATEFMHRLIEKAYEEIGYVAKKGMIMLRVMQMPEDRISITISEPAFDELLGQELAEKMETLFKKISELEQSNVDRMEEEQPIEAVHRMEEADEKILNQVIVNHDVTVLSFPHLSFIEEFAKSIQYGRPIQSDLYKKEDSYLLIIRRGAMAEASYAKICFSAFDFNATLLEENMAAYLYEHGECFIKKKALSVMKKI